MLSQLNDRPFGIPLSLPQYIGGFVVSRPDTPTEIFLPGVPDKEAELYLHPGLRVQAPQKPPKLKTAFDIYSFGLLLAEIGFWNTLLLLWKDSVISKRPRMN
jgi:hypothetical protein